MRKLAFNFLIIIITTTLCQIFTLPLFAQTKTPRPDPYQNYLRALNDFNQKRSAFESSRTRYNSFKTLQAKESVTSDAKAMLNQANETLLRFIIVTGGNLQSLESRNPQVKERIIADLRLHGEYLTSISNTLGEVPTFQELNTYSEALTTRYGYINSTVTQTLSYHDCIKILQMIDDMKIILDDLESANQSLPQELDSVKLVQEWVSNSRQQTLQEEEKIVEYLSVIYPQPATQTLNNKPVYETGEFNNDPQLILRTRESLRDRTNQAKDTYNILVETYQKI